MGYNAKENGDMILTKMTFDTFRRKSSIIKGKKLK